MRWAKLLTTLLTIFIIFGCEGETTGAPSSLGSDVLLLARDVAAEPDAIVDAYIPVWDAEPDQIIDAEVDAEPPVVCSPAGSHDPCQIEELQGPCAYGQRTCMITEWSDCHQIVNPRMEVCNRFDDDCDGHVNEAPNTSQNNTLSQPCYGAPIETIKVGICHGGVAQCEDDADFGWGYHNCRNQRLPRDELCNNFDDDCDNSVDEGVVNDCGECGDPPVEVCDTVDNDCDGTTDEGLLNACDQCGEVPEELCDYEDNDCDGHTDEGLGNCECGNPTYVPMPEVCNGIDEDCDGMIDEGPNGGPLTMLCATDVRTGEINTFERREDGPQYVGNHCRIGLAFCDARQDGNGIFEWGYFECMQEILPANERCNEMDDDCDGIPDEGFNQGTVAVMMIMDVSGSMQVDEINEAFTAVTNTVQNLFAQGAVDICYLLAVVGNDNEFDPYLSIPAHTCVPGVDPQTDIDMTTAVSALLTNIQNGTINQGGGTENTLDAMGDFFTDDLIDWDQDGFLDDIQWNTNDPNSRVHSIDLSLMNHRIVVVMGDEPAQGDFWDDTDVADAMRRSGGMAFIIGPPTLYVRESYQRIIDAGGEYYESITRRHGLRNERTIAEAVETAIDEAACLQDDPEEEEEEPEEMACHQTIQSRKPVSIYRLAAYGMLALPRYDFVDKICL